MLLAAQIGSVDFCLRIAVSRHHALRLRAIERVWLPRVAAKHVPIIVHDALSLSRPDTPRGLLTLLRSGYAHVVLRCTTTSCQRRHVALVRARAGGVSLSRLIAALTPSRQRR